MLEKQERSSGSSKPWGQKKKYLYLDKFESYKLSNDEKLKLINRAVKGVYIVLGIMFVFAVGMTIYHMLK